MTTRRLGLGVWMIAWPLLSWRIDLMELFKTTIVIWSDFNPRELELSTLAREAESGDAYCSSLKTVKITSPTTDPDWDGTEFFSYTD